MDTELETTILQMVSDDPNGVPTERICRYTHKTPQELGDTFERLISEKKLLGFAGLWISPAGYERGAVLLVEALRDLHAALPTESAISPRRAAMAADLKWDGKPFDRILTKLVADGKIESFADGIRLKEFLLELSLRQRGLLDRVLQVLQSQPISTPSPQTIAQTLGIPRQAIEEILRLGIRSGEIIQLAEAVYYTPTQFDALQLQIFEIVGDKPFTSTELRDTLQTTRKYLLPILDRLDELGITQKTGTHRVFLPGSDTH